MPYKDPEKRREAQRRYQQSERGEQRRLRFKLSQESRKNGEEFSTPLTISAQALAAVLSNWWKEQ